MEEKKRIEKPVGLQIQYWFLVLILLVISINIVGIISVFQIQRRLSIVTNKYQPIADICEGIYNNTLSAQIETYRYLSGYSQDTKQLTTHLTEIQNLIEEASKLELSPTLNNQLNQTQKLMEKYVKSIQVLEKTTSWDQKDQIQANLINMNKEIMEIASQAKTQASKEILENNALSHTTIKKVIFLFCGLLGVSIIITFFEHRWWGKLQEMFLKL